MLPVMSKVIHADELKSAFDWLSLQAHKDYIKCVLDYKCLHGMAPLNLLTEFKHANQTDSYDARWHYLVRLSFPFLLMF